MHKYVKSTIVVAAIAAAYLVGVHHAHAQTTPVAATTTVNFGGADAGLDLDALHLDNASVDTKTKFDFGYNGRVGYGVQTSQGYFLGAELLDGTNSGVVRNGPTKDSTGNSLALDARAGKVVGSTLLYGKVGYALTNVTEENLADGVSNTADFSGYRLGGGVEHFLAPNVTGRVDVVYTGYGSRTLDGNSVDPSNVKATVGASYKFQ